jgi:DNA-binding response OmpR family regulator
MTQENAGTHPAAASARPPADLLDRRILVVEDTSEVALLVADYLREVVRNVLVCGDGRSALETVKREPIDLIVLDLMLPELGGLEVCRALRASGTPTLILMLTAKSTELDRIVGLEFGADDYMVKPFSVLELVARVRALFRRLEVFRASAAPPLERRIRVADLLIDPLARQAYRSGRDLSLTEKEFDLLYLFASNPSKVFARSQLLDLVWGYGSGIYEYTVTSHINRLRSKIEPDPANPTIIQTVWGVGYRLQASTCQ